MHNFTVWTEITRKNESLLNKLKKPASNDPSILKPTLLTGIISQLEDLRVD